MVYKNLRTEIINILNKKQIFCTKLLLCVWKAQRPVGSMHLKILQDFTKIAAN